MRNALLFASFADGISALSTGSLSLSPAHRQHNANSNPRLNANVSIHARMRAKRVKNAQRRTQQKRRPREMRDENM